MVAIPSKYSGETPERPRIAKMMVAIPPTASANMPLDVSAVPIVVDDVGILITASFFRVVLMV
jgi:hypothetical protein